MTSNPAALAASIILLFPMGYFFLASPAFLFVKLDIPQVTQLLRGMFNVQFVMMGIVGAIGTLAFALAGHPAFATAVGLVAAFAILGRRSFLDKMDAQLSARDAGDREAVRRLRRLHWAGMLCNAVLLVAFVSSLPYVASV
jgi:ABC-type microcin C transport system permease subunit YejB